MENSEDTYKEKYKQLLDSIPSTTIALRVKPQIKLVLEQEAKKQEVTLSHFLNEVIQKELMSIKEGKERNGPVQAIKIENEDLKRQISELKERLKSYELGLYKDNSSGEVVDLKANIIKELTAQVEKYKNVVENLENENQNQKKLLNAHEKLREQRKRMDG